LRLRHHLAQQLRDKSGPEFGRVPKRVEARRFVLAHKFNLKARRGAGLLWRRAGSFPLQAAGGAGFFDRAGGRRRTLKRSAAGTGDVAIDAHACQPRKVRAAICAFLSPRRA
jgi:hypothetical protein